MRTIQRALVVVGVATAISVSGCTQQTTGIEAAAEAMGATNLNSIQFSGSGLVFGFGQAYQPGDRWPRFFQRTYSLSANYQTPGMRLEQVRAQGEVPPGAGRHNP